MLKKCLLASGLIVALAIGGSAQTSTPAAGQQQNPTQQQAAPQPPAPAAVPAPTPRPAAQAAPPQSSASTTLSGCLYREQDVPGRTPNVAERAGILEDYILATMAPTPAPAGATPSPTGTSGSAGAMFKLEKIDDNQLKTLVGKRVEVTGRVDAEARDAAPGGAAPNRNLGPDRIELPEFEVASIKEISGSCPATPARP